MGRSQLLNIYLINMPPFVMQQFSEIEPLRAELKTLAGVKVAFVPTMGSLHAGHLALVRRARELADFVVVSIYVNPTQFGKGEDFSTYPKSLVQDILKLEEAGADLLFTPSDEVIYPGRGESSDGGSCRVELPAVSEVLCGESRPGHFSGVATVVAKLFNIVMPDISLFGEKDFQQLHIIRRMVADLNFPIEIVGVSTVRDSDGLALSSRNEYLTLEQRSVAPELYRVLCWVVGEVKQAERAVAEIEQEIGRAHV